MDQIRFELIDLVPWVVIWVFFTKKNNLGLKGSLTLFALMGYGPLYSLIKIGSPPYVIPLSLITSIALIALNIKLMRFAKLSGYVFMILLLTITSSINLSDQTAILKAFLFLTISIAGLLVGFDFTLHSKSRLLHIIVSAICYNALSVVLIRYFFAIDLRDAGFSISLIGFTVYLIVTNRRITLASLSALIYLFAIQTRTVVADVILSFVLSIRQFVPIFGRSKLTLFSLILGVAVAYVLYLRMSTSIAVLDALYDGMITRLNGAYTELHDFLGSPIIGNGIFYYNSIQQKMIEAVIDGALESDKFIAYNHIGIVSVLSQVGVCGFLLLIGYPCYQFIKTQRLVGRTPIAFAIRLNFILFIVSFFISGSPLRTDFLDQLYYMFTVGYFLATSYAADERESSFEPS